MLLKLAALSMITAATTHLQQVGPSRVQWIYDTGAQKGYVCAVVQQNGAAFDVYLPAIWPAPAPKAGGPALSALPLLHYAKQATALEAVNAYCPLTAPTQP